MGKSIEQKRIFLVVGFSGAFGLCKRIRLSEEAESFLDTVELRDRIRLSGEEESVLNIHGPIDRQFTLHADRLCEDKIAHGL